MKIPSSFLICATIIVALEVIGLVILIGAHDDPTPLIAYLTSINAVLVSAGSILWKLEKQDVTARTRDDNIGHIANTTDQLMNGELEDKIAKVMHDEFSDMIGEAVKNLPASKVPKPRKAP